MRQFYDERETADPEARETALMAALAKAVAAAGTRTAHFGRTLAGIDPASVTTRAALADLPVTYKSDLIAAQESDPPFGGLAATDAGALLHLFLSPGPIAEPEGTGRDWWRGARSLWAAGFRAGDRVLNTFSYHFTPAGMIFDSAAREIGCAVFPGGVGQTEMQIQAIRHFRLNGFTGTPDFLKIILEKADETGSDVSSLEKALVGGGPLTPTIREAAESRGVSVLQNYGTADLGIVAYETEAREGLVLSEDVIVEIVKPGTGDPVPDGEVGEVLVTLVANPDYPLIRFATGDLSAVLPGPSPCGRTAPRIRGWMGRADQSTKVRGMFVRPEQIARVERRHPEIRRARLVVGSENDRDTMTLLCEVDGQDGSFGDRVAETLQQETRIRGIVELRAPGDLPADGKVIVDERDHG